MRLFFKALRETKTMIDNTINFITTYNPKIGMKVHITTGLDSMDYQEMAIQLSAHDSNYKYFLEVWTKRDEWKKAMEFSFSDTTKGEFVWHPYALISTYYEGTMDKLQYIHESSQKSMIWDVEYSTNNPNLNLMKTSIVSNDSMITIYMTAHLDSNFAGTSEKDAYLIGAKIRTQSPHLAVMKCGIEDIGTNYDNNFTQWSQINTNNAALFTMDGFQTDGNSDGIFNGNTYPSPNSIQSSNLYSSTEVEAVSVTFSKPGDKPEFVE
jgi:hypothetical protein